MMDGTLASMGYVRCPDRIKYGRGTGTANYGYYDAVDDSCPDKDY